ncbi:MAG: glycosyltransferase family 2 protein [Dechloromonas sp.]|jgi:glycosyltransferase involved in cell wall biosynthesis|nr:MAG: glycosyltransferase family 2 protein [Dechloromonas sp.]
MRISVVLPARNEATSLLQLLPAIKGLLPEAEVIVVNDGSNDETESVASRCGARVFSNPYPQGNGAAVKVGARRATGDMLVFMDADSQHPAEDIQRLIEKLESGYDMVVGARDGAGQASRHRGFANAFYNRLASWMVGHKVRDLTSGFRAVRRDKFLEFLYLLPNGFSYPTTITMAFFRAGYSVAYEPIAVQPRMQGTSSHIRLWRDGIRFLLIIFKIGTLYSPLKLFAPVALAHAIIGLGYYAYSYLSFGRLSLATIFMLTSSVTIFLIGLVSEQITQLMYRPSETKMGKSEQIGGL